MSTVVRPSGPLPPRVYWVRRLLLLAVVAVLVWGVVRVVGGDPANGEPANDEPAGDAATVTPDAPTDDTARRRPQRTPRELREERRRARLAERAELRVRDVEQTLAEPAGPCDLTLVRVAPQVPSPAYARTSVLLRLGLRTDQATPCTIDLDADRLLVSVSSVGQVVVDEVTSEATEIVWSTAQCGDAVPDRTVVLRPSWTSTVDLAWSGRLSGRRCRPDARPVAAGSYRLQAAALTGEPAEVDFDLVDPSSMDRPVYERQARDGSDPGDRAAVQGGRAGGGQPGTDTDRPAGPSGDDEQAVQDGSADQGNGQQAGQRANGAPGGGE